MKDNNFYLTSFILARQFFFCVQYLYLALKYYDEIKRQIILKVLKARQQDDVLTYKLSDCHVNRYEPIFIGSAITFCSTSNRRCFSKVFNYFDFE